MVSFYKGLREPQPDNGGEVFGVSLGHSCRPLCVLLGAFVVFEHRVREGFFLIRGLWFHEGASLR